MYATTNQIKQRIGPQLTSYWDNRRNYAGFSDSQYFIFTPAEVKRIVAQNPVSGNANLGEGFDCDDFTYAMKGNLAISNRDKYGYKASLGIGIAWGYFSWMKQDGLHATNWFMDPDGIIYWLEPQNNTIYSLNQCVPGSLTLLLL